MKRIRIKLLMFLVIITSLCTFLIGCSKETPVTVDYWPTTAWKTSTPEAQGIDSELINKMFENIKDSNLGIHSLLIIRNGYLVTEGHYYPYKKENRHILNSVTKSLTSGLVGLAIEDGYMKSIDQKVISIYPDVHIENMDERKKNITIKNLVTMTPGFKWEENGNYFTPTDSNTQMWKSENQAQFVLNRPMAEEPGKTFYYNTGASHLVGAIIEKTSKKTLLEYANEKIFKQLGISDISWRIDKQGIYSGGGGVFMKPEDLAKYGYLYLNKGLWDGKQLIPKKWVEESTKKQIDTPNGLAGRYGYGYQWWQNKFGGYSARGALGQYLFIVPEQNLVVVFTGGLEGPDFFMPEKLMEEYIIPSIKAPTAINENSQSLQKLNNTLKDIAKEPSPVHVEALPAIASEISGKTFIMENGETYCLEFNSGNECTLHWFTDNIMYDVKVGLDNVYRSSDMKEFYWKNMVSKAGFRGSWTDSNTFIVDLRPLEDCNYYEMKFEFDGDKLHYTWKSILSGAIVTDTTGTPNK